MPATCQPLATRRIRVEANCGVCAMTELLNICRRSDMQLARSCHRVEQIKIPALIRIGGRRTGSSPAGTGDVNRWIGVDGGPHVQASVPEIARRYHEFMAQLLLKGRVPVLLVSRLQVRAIFSAYAGERSKIRERVVLRRRQRLRERSTQALERIAKSANRVSELQQTAPRSGVGHKIGVIHFRIIVSYRVGRTEGLPAVDRKST